MMRRLLIILIVLFSNVSFCQFVAGNETYRNLQIKHCIYYNAYFNALYTQIFKDKFNLYWCTSEAGMVRYDGNQFTLFEYPQFTYKNVRKVCTDNNRFIWILLNSSQWIEFDTQKESYRALDNFYSIDQAIDVYGYNDNILVVEDGSLMLLNRDRFLKRKAFSFSGDYINMYGFNQYIVLLTTHHIYIYNSLLNRQTTLDSNELNLNLQQITSLSFDANNLLICDSEMNLHNYNMRTNSCSVLNISDSISSHIDGIIKIKESEYLLYSTDGIYLFNPLCTTTGIGSNSLINVYKLNPYLSTLITHKITDIKYDEKNNTFWLSYKENCLIKLTLNNSTLETKQTLSCGKPINNIIEDKMGNVWIATNGAGIYRSTTNSINDETKFEPFDSNQMDNNYFICTKDRENLIIANTNGLVESVDLLGHRRTILFENQSLLKDLKSIFVSSNDKLWFANAEGIALYDLQTMQYEASAKLDVEAINNVSFAEDLLDNVWMGNDSGLFRIEVLGNRLSFEDHKGNEENEKLKKVLAIYVDHDNNLLVSTPKGLYTVDVNSRQIKCLVNNNKNSHPISEIVEDNQGNLWFGSKSTIFSNSNIEGKLYRYPISGEAPKVCKLRNGTLMWVNNLGVITYDPKEVIGKNDSRSAVLMDIKLNNNKQKKKTEYLYLPQTTNLARCTNQFNLKHNENSLILYTSEGIYKNYYNPLHYRVIPGDTIWKAVSDNYISLNNLRPGKYNVQIKSISPNRFDNNNTSINLHVRANYLWLKILVSIIVIIVSVFVIIVLVCNNYRKLINSILTTGKTQLGTNDTVEKPVCNISGDVDTISCLGKHSLKIVLVEYYSGSLKYLENILSECNTIYIANNGESALLIASKHSPDLLIVDSTELFLLDFNFYRSIKQKTNSPEVTIITYKFLVKGLDTSVLDIKGKEYVVNRLDYILNNKKNSDFFNRKLQKRIAMGDEEKEENDNKHCEFICNVEDVISQNIDSSDFSVKQLAASFNMSQSSFYRKMKELTNESIIMFVRRVKMKKALELLQTQQYHVHEVAEQVGYNDVATFRKHFANFYNTTPSKYYEIK